jgi:hypothetical protein
MLKVSITFWGKNLEGYGSISDFHESDTQTVRVSPELYEIYIPHLVPSQLGTILVGYEQPILGPLVVTG